MPNIQETDGRAQNEPVIRLAAEFEERFCGFLDRFIFGGPTDVFGLAAIGVTLLWALLFPELRRARTFELAEEPPPQDAVIATGV